MKRIILTLVAMVAGAVLLTGCGPDVTHITVGADQLYGLWKKTGTQEYWRYRANGTGVTWDVADDVTEEESNMVFTWSVDGDVLTHIFTGIQGNQAIPKVYTVTEISASAMKWKDDYGITYSFMKEE